VNFENLGAPKVDLVSGKLSGSVYSANCGWIALSNAFAFVQTDSIAPGADIDGDGLADAWERQNFGGLAQGAGGDPDVDGATNLQEYLAGTDPNDVNSKLAITAFDTSSGGTSPTLIWNSTLTRQYWIEKTLSLTPPMWFDSGLGLIQPDGASTTRNFGDTNAPMRFYRGRAVKPLTP
jgi:Bacterial TSP3 repeat